MNIMNFNLNNEYYKLAKTEDGGGINNFWLLPKPKAKSAFFLNNRFFLKFEAFGRALGLFLGRSRINF